MNTILLRFGRNVWKKNVFYQIQDCHLSKIQKAWFARQAPPVRARTEQNEVIVMTEELEHRNGRWWIQGSVKTWPKKKIYICICGLGIFGIKERCRIQDIDQKVKIVFRSMVFNVQQWIGRITHTHTHTHTVT